MFPHCLRCLELHLPFHVFIHCLKCLESPLPFYATAHNSMCADCKYSNSACLVLCPHVIIYGSTLTPVSLPPCLIIEVGRLLEDYQKYVQMRVVLGMKTDEWFHPKCQGLVMKAFETIGS